MDFSLEASHDHCNDHALLSSVAEILDNVQMEPSLTDLTIEIVGFRSDACAAFGYKLSGMTFRILHSFTSRSLSHDDISRFAIRQPNLEYLTIGGSECEGVCPLQLLEHCGRIVSLTGHGVASCVSSIVPGNPVTDVWILDASRTYGEDCQFMNVLLKLRESSASITHLTLSFPAAQLDILSLILIAAPQVEMLDLRESDSVGRKVPGSQAVERLQEMGISTPNAAEAPIS
ncbi:hypothetical protein SCHPADRAFT_948202 [Schizopora paradoxa]|uniref:F-box domain-containing protein n=1 Tax=Schizopora paradoxa TaxID=27342 RepID=A0A0H2R395_9AGAM|nr:hypothetical protein SCHPADRAFT_948202 [Schizopora paradoxa]